MTPRLKFWESRPREVTVFLLAPHLMWINWLIEVWPAQISLVNLCWFPSVQWSLSGGEERGAGLVEVCGGLGGVAVPRRSAASHSFAPTAVERHGSRRVQQEPGVPAVPFAASSRISTGAELSSTWSGTESWSFWWETRPPARPVCAASVPCLETTGSLPAGDASPGHKQTHRYVSLRAERRLDGAAVSQHGSNRQRRWIFWKIQQIYVTYT